MNRKEIVKKANEWYFKQYIDYRKNRGFSFKTRKKTEQAIDHLKAFLGEKSLHKMRTEDIAELRQYLEECTYRKHKLSQNTVVNILSQIKLFFEYLQGMSEFFNQISQDFMGMLSLSPSQKQARKNIGRKIKKYPKKEDISKILSAIDNNIIGRRDRALISFCFFTGARISAIATMKLGLVDLQERVVTQDPTKGVTVKFNKLISTTMPRFDDNMFQNLSSWIEELRSLGYIDDDPLFPAAEINKGEGISEFQCSNTLTKNNISPSSAERIIKHCCKEAGFEEYHAHSFRDSHIYYALAMATNGLDIKAVSVNVGHENVSMTMVRYADLSADQVHERISNLGKSGEDSLNNSDIMSKLNEIVNKLDSEKREGGAKDEEN